MSSDTPERREGLVALGLLLLSAAILLLEVGQVRIFSFILWHHVTYLVVTVTLLGFAAGATWLSVSRRVLGELRAGRSAFFFGLLSLLTFAVLARHDLEVLPRADARLPAVFATAAYLYLVIPFFFGGCAIAAALDGEGQRISRRYAVNMVGSALGAILAIPVVRLFGGPGVVLVAAGLGTAAASAFMFAAGRRGFGALSLLVALLSFAVIPVGDRLFPFPVAAGKTLDREIKAGANPIATYWDPICRIDVVGDEEEDLQLRVYQDGDAPTTIASAERANKAGMMFSHQALGYLINFDPTDGSSRDRALVIGVGGGSDVLTALLMGATEVTGAEINESTARMMRERFAEYSGGLYSDPRVNIEVADGRSVIARTDRIFDIIQITGADTYAALASGANIVAESYLYTQEAIDDYLAHLADDGVLCILRFRFYPPRETLRLVGMLARGLVKTGVVDPAQHIAVVSIDNEGKAPDGTASQSSYATAIVKKTPFTKAEVDRIQEFCEKHPRAESFHASLLPGEGGEREYVDYVQAIREGEGVARKFEEEYAYAIDPVTDDRPFFFQFFRGKDVLGDRAEEAGEQHFRVVIGVGPAGLQVLWLSLGASLLLVGLLVFMPLFAFRRDGLRVRGVTRMVLFFSAVGLAYLAVEIATMQRLTLYLGHPLKALGIGLTTFLLGSGIGAAVSGRVMPGNEKRGVLISGLLAALLLLLHAFFVPSILRETLFLSDGGRELVAVLLVAPLAFVMGFPFPLGLRYARERAGPLLPWAFGVNGGASVVASLVAILFAMEWGFTSVLLVGVALYLLASFILPARRSAS